MDARELRGLAFSCLEGCGFCCTFQPEVSGRELALLRARLKPRPVAVAHGDGRTYLQLQNKCGACTLLERRQCTQYDLRPAHCRYFPFHLHFAEQPEAYVNYACRGVARSEAGDLSEAFRASVLGPAAPDEVREHERLAREAYGAFTRKARRAGAWGDARAAIAQALDEGPRMLTGAWVEDATRRAGEPATADEALEEALAPFGEADVARRPFWLPADLRWLTFAREGARLEALEMDEAGALHPTGRAATLARWEDPDPEVAAGLHAYARRLAERSLLVGSVYALVDDRGYALKVEDAALLRMAEVAADLVVRARILAALGVPEAALADETARFYDSTFLDAPTIGGFL